MKKIAVIILLMLCFNALKAQQTELNGEKYNVIILGNDSARIGSELLITTLSDPITKTPIELARCIVQQNGDFYASFYIENTSKIFFPLQAITGQMFAEPDNKYTISLPPIVPQTRDDSLNPYFQPKLFYLGIKNPNPTDINILISKFEALYDEYLQFNFAEVMLQPNRAKIEKQIARFDSIFAEVESPFFKNYLQFRYAELRHISVERQKNFVINKYFKNSEIFYTNPAYTKLFESVFNQYFNYVQNNRNCNIGAVIEQKSSFLNLKDSLMKFEEMGNEKLCEYLILSELYSSFFTLQYSQEAVMKMTDSILVQTKFSEHKQIAAFMKERFENLYIGKSAPEFALQNSEGIIISRNTYPNKFIYLTFASVNSYTALLELEALKIYHQRYNQFFQIITICTDNSMTEMTEIAKKNGYTWQFVHIANSDLMQQLNIRVIPTYFLISPEGKLAMSPAPSPTENFEERFQIIWRERLNQQIRQNSNNNSGGGVNLRNY